MGRAGGDATFTLVECAPALQARIEALRQEIAAAAQEVYEVWPGGDGWGGCAAIAEAISFCLHQHLRDLDDVEVFSLDCETDPPHTVTYVEMGEECFTVDIPWSLYESYRRRSGETYFWTRIGGVRFSPDSVVITAAR